MPFWLKPFLLKHCTACACGEYVFFFLFFLLLGQTWQFMPRKGWTSFPTPSGWYEVIRGPRPKSEEWPRHQQWHPRRQGWWPAVSEPSKPRVQRRWQRGTTPRANPDDVKAARCRARWMHLARPSLRRLGAKERFLVVQVEECQAFIKRSQNRLVWLEEQRVRQQEELDAAMGRMAKLQEEMAKSIPIPPTTPGPHTAGQGPRACFGGREAEVTHCRDGDGTGGGTEETFQIIVSSFVRPRWRVPIWRCKSGEHCTASKQDRTEGRSWRLSSAEGAL